MLKLEPFTPNDFYRFISWIDNERFMYQFAGPLFTFPVTKKQLYEYITDKNRKVYKVVDRETGRAVGHGEINRIDCKNKNARLSRILVANKSDRNKGWGTKIIEELLKIAFTELNLHRIDLGVFEFNKAALKCYKNCGFSIEGLLRESFLIDDEYISVYNMSILKNEWELRQKNMG